MSPYTRGALFLIRLIASGLIVLGITLLGSYFFFMVSGKKAEGGALGFILKLLPLLAGALLWIKSHAIAQKLTEDFDE